MRKKDIFSSENCHFYTREKSQYIAWTRYCNDTQYLHCGMSSAQLGRRAILSVALFINCSSSSKGSLSSSL